MRISLDIDMAVDAVERSVNGWSELLRVDMDANRLTTDVFGELLIVVAGQTVRIGRLRPCRNSCGE
jgi:hypothetical protein